MKTPLLISLPTQRAMGVPPRILGWNRPTALPFVSGWRASFWVLCNLSFRTHMSSLTVFCSFPPMFGCLCDQLLSHYKSEYFRCFTCRRSGGWLFSTPLLCLMRASWTSPPRWFTGAHATDREPRYRSLSHQASCRGLGGRTLSLYLLALLSVSHPSFRLYSR